MNMHELGRCSVKSECRHSEELSRWLPYSYASCPRILLVEPRHVQKLPTRPATDSSLVRLEVLATVRVLVTDRRDQRGKAVDGVRLSVLTIAPLKSQQSETQQQR